jgi:hypothetical protein
MIKKSMVLYHRTTKENADQILARQEFHGSARCGTSEVLNGVYLTEEKPVKANDGTVVLKVTIRKSDAEVTKYKCSENGEFVIPAMWFKHASEIEIAND